MTTEQNKAIVTRFNKEVIEGKRVELMDELFSPDFINRTVRPGFSPGPDGMVAFLKIMWNAFSDMQVTIHDQVAEGDKVTSRKTISGIHTGTFNNFNPTQKKVEFKIIDIVRLENGKYAEHWSVIDMQGVLDHLRA